MHDISSGMVHNILSLQEQDALLLASLAFRPAPPTIFLKNERLRPFSLDSELPAMQGSSHKLYVTRRCRWQASVR